MNPPFAPPDPRLFASVCVERPNRALVRLLVGGEVGVAQDVEELGAETKACVLGDTKDPLRPAEQ